MKHPRTPAARRRKHRIFLVEDHPVTRHGFTQLLNQEADLEVCGEAGCAAKAVPGIAAARPDLVIADISLVGASGLELIKDLVRLHPRLPILMLSTHDEALYAERALRAGARGYVMKQEPVEHVMTAIRQVLRGDLYLSESMRARLVHRHVRGANAITVSDIEHLSDRELEVFRLLGRGLGTRQVAGQLHLSVSTIETYRGQIKKKLGLARAPELTRRAVEWVHSQDS
jgi:DNA-binding NarL/FixJ family response regulator